MERMTGKISVTAATVFAGLLVSSPAAADFDCQRTNLCQRQAAAARRAEPVAKTARRARTGKATRGFTPSRTAVRRRVEKQRRDRPRVAVTRTPPAPKDARCRTKPAVCARLKR